MCSHLGAVPLAPAAAPPCFGGTQPGTYLIPRQLQPIGCTKGGTASCERRGFYFKGFVCGATPVESKQTGSIARAQGGGHMQVAEFNIGFFCRTAGVQYSFHQTFFDCPGAQVLCAQMPSPPRALARPQTALKVPDARRPVILHVCTRCMYGVLLLRGCFVPLLPWSAALDSKSSVVRLGTTRDLGLVDLFNWPRPTAKKNLLSTGRFVCAHLSTWPWAHAKNNLRLPFALPAAPVQSLSRSSSVRVREPET